MQDNAIAPEPASFFSRLAAGVYEILLLAAVIFIASVPVAPFAQSLAHGWPRFLYQLYLLAVLYGYFAAFWRKSGQTLAMKTWRIKLVDDHGERLGLRRGLLRFGAAAAFPLAGMGVAYALVGGIHAVAWGAVSGWAVDWFGAFADQDRQFLHDRLARTRIVRVPRKA